MTAAWLSALGLHLRHTSSDRELALYPPPFQKVWVTEGNSGARCVPPYFTLVGNAYCTVEGLPLEPKWLRWQRHPLHTGVRKHP